MQLLPQDIRQPIPDLYSQEHEKDPMVFAKFFTPTSSLTWFVTELSKRDHDTCFGYILDGSQGELGYFSLQFLQGQQAMITLHIQDEAGTITSIAMGGTIPAVERDVSFTPRRLSKAKAEQLRRGDEGPI